MAAKKKAGTRRKAAPKKARARSVPDAWRKPFLAALAVTGNVAAAARAAGVARSTPIRAREADKDFAAAWAEALEESTDALELEARRRAHDGLRRLKFFKGEPIMVPVPGPDGRPELGGDGEPVLVPYTEHEYSDTLLIFLLKGNRPEKYRERVDLRHTGDPVQVQVYLPANGRDPPPAGPPGAVPGQPG